MTVDGVQVVVHLWLHGFLVHKIPNYSLRCPHLHVLRLLHRQTGLW
jgi:hypothetical protein